jgi:cell division protein FtsI (penicillin-binding protein 3)
MAAQPTVFQRRIHVGAAISLFAFIVVGGQLVHVTAFHAAQVQARKAPQAALTRSDLVDRNGELIARALPADDLYARPQLIKDKRAAALALADATGADPERVAAVLKDKYTSALIARQVSQAARAKVAALKLPGLEYLPNSKRDYPFGRTTAQVVGVTDSEGKGVSGLELGLEERLKSGNSPVASSIDTRVQFILTHETAAAMAEFRARAAGGLVLDVNTGEVLAMASLPDFDPNARNFTAGDSGRNIMVQDVYELGSVFKILAFALAIEDRKVRLDESLPIGNGYKIGRFTIHEAEHMPASLRARDVLAQSSNIGTAQIALRSGPERQQAFLANMGLLKPLRSELPERARPLYPTHWGIIETATIGFGHGISVSPLAFAAAVASVVNGGRRITPTLLKNPADSRSDQVVSAETSATMRGLLRYVVTDGTGKKADVPGYDVGGKTGSAEKSGGRRGYQAHKLVTSFCAVFPIENPRYLVFVVLDEPHGTKATGGFALAGYTAAPLAGHVIARIAPLLGVPINPITVAKENHNGSG